MQSTAVYEAAICEFYQYFNCVVCVLHKCSILQVIKQSLSQRVVDEHQIERHFTSADLSELYNFFPDRLDDPDRPEKPTPVLPKVLAIFVFKPESLRFVWQILIVTFEVQILFFNSHTEFYMWAILHRLGASLK